MGVVIDVFLAVAVVAVTAGAIPKFQFGITDIRSTTDGAFVGIGGFDGSGSCLVRAGRGEGDDLRLPLFAAFFALKHPSGIGLPSNGNEIQHILTEE